MDDEVIKVETDLVINDVLVKDQDGNAVTDLRKDEFVVFDEGVPQVVEVFASGGNSRLPCSIVLILEINHFEFRFLSKSIQGAKTLVDRLNPEDKMAIVSADVKILVGFTRDKKLIKAALDSLLAEIEDQEISKGKGMFFPVAGRNLLSTLGFGTSEFESLLAVLNEMFTPEDQRPIIIFQGGGNEIFRIKTGDDSLWRSYTSQIPDSAKFNRYLEFNDIVETIERSRATIYSVIPGLRMLDISKKEQQKRAALSAEIMTKQAEILLRLPGNKMRRARLARRYQDAELNRLVAAQSAMRQVAELSGGQTSFLEKPEDAESIYSNILTIINNRYTIGYYPTERPKKGKPRDVVVRVLNHPEFTVIGRRSYRF